MSLPPTWWQISVQTGSTICASVVTDCNNNPQWNSIWIWEKVPSVWTRKCERESSTFKVPSVWTRKCEWKSVNEKVPSVWTRKHRSQNLPPSVARHTLFSPPAHWQSSPPFAKSPQKMEISSHLAPKKWVKNGHFKPPRCTAARCEVQRLARLPQAHSRWQLWGNTPGGQCLKNFLCYSRPNLIRFFKRGNLSLKFLIVELARCWIYPCLLHNLLTCCNKNIRYVYFVMFMTLVLNRYATNSGPHD